MQTEAKNGRSARAFKKKQPQVIENPKQAMFIRGHKTSQIITDVLSDMYALKKPFSIKYNNRKKNTEHGPFEDISSVEFLGTKSDSSLFVYGSHSKKRPHNLILGRLFDYHMLDMVEFGVTAFTSMSEFNSQNLPMLGSKPCFSIVGAQFQTDIKYSTIANLIVDFFRGKIVDNINLRGLDHVICLSLSPSGGTVLFRHYYIHMRKSGSRVPRVELEEIGPSLDLVLRRSQFGAEALRNLALKVPKELAPKKKKNVSTNAFHDVVGEVHVRPQKLDEIHEKVKKPKALRKRSLSKAGQESNPDSLDDNEQQVESESKKIKTH